jgi:hypothetical protein
MDFLRGRLAGHFGLILGGDLDAPQFDDHVEVRGMPLGGVQGARSRRSRLRPWTLHVSDEIPVITPIAASVRDWPACDAIDRNGHEL